MKPLAGGGNPRRVSLVVNDEAIARDRGKEEWQWI
jgi:hypothetical protein